MPTKRKWTQEEIEAEIKAFDWSPIDRMTDEEIEAAAAADPDAPPASDEQLRRAIEARAARLRRSRKPAAE